MELFWNSLDNAPSSIVFYLEMKVEVDVGVHDIRTRFTSRKLGLIHAPWCKNLSLVKNLRCDDGGCKKVGGRKDKRLVETLSFSHQYISYFFNKNYISSL